MATAQGKGPEVQQHQPSLDHDKPLKGKPMNVHIDTTAAGHAASFPIPYPSQSSFDDLEDALSMLRVVMELMGDDRGFSKDFAQDLNVVIGAAKDRLGPILIHLHNLDKDDCSDRYQQARRAWLLERGRGA